MVAALFSVCSPGTKRRCSPSPSTNLFTNGMITLSFSGIISFKNADDVRAAATIVPHDRLLVETDAPYLAPVPHRGRPNRAAWVVDVGVALAAAVDRPVDEIAEVTRRNATAVFGHPR